ncbi:hypothetical protein ACFWP2_39095 [Kitasatospora sp. NPDC058444]|uniref:hypothetical protein n=1 Tax=Kitasatospora sp. NPDC058444 TaxID=3346504 RepID=UPI0036510DD0
MKTTKKLRQLAIGAATATLALTGVLAGAGNATAADGYQMVRMQEPGVLYKNTKLSVGDTQLVMQNDGNLVMYVTDPSGGVTAPWSTRSVGCGDRAIMQGDGNFVVYDSNNRVCWANNTFKSGPGTAALELHSGGGLHIDLGAGSSNFFMHQLTLRLGSSDPY